MPRGRDDDVVGHGFEIANGRAIHLSVRDDGCDIVGGGRSTACRQRVEIIEKIDQRLHPILI